MVGTYYVSIMGMTTRYLYDSFKSPLPWSECRDSWNAACVASLETNTANYLYSDPLSNSTTITVALSNASAVVDNSLANPKSSAELYFM